MRSTENNAMSSVGTIYKPTFGTSVLGQQDETWSNAGTVACDVWPMSRAMEEKNTQTGDISEGDFYISVPYDTDVDYDDIIDINGITYQLTFVPNDVSWLTNKRLHATNYNSELRNKD
jgi:hypothetical protein